MIVITQARWPGFLPGLVSCEETTNQKALRFRFLFTGEAIKIRESTPVALGHMDETPAPMQEAIDAAVAALLAAALWLNIATVIGAPVSTTHSIVGGVLGAGVAAVAERAARAAIAIKKQMPKMTVSIAELNMADPGSAIDKCARAAEAEVRRAALETADDANSVRIGATVASALQQDQRVRAVSKRFYLEVR